MNIQTVAENLRKTIAGKEKYIQELTATLAGEDTDGVDRIVLRTTIKFLEVNINELKVILFDVEKCCEKATADSWALNPDRSGGAFTDEEIARSGEWH
jgi:hypothetical protein